VNPNSTQFDPETDLFSIRLRQSLLLPTGHLLGYSNFKLQRLMETGRPALMHTLEHHLDGCGRFLDEDGNLFKVMGTFDRVSGRR
jgi:hypothetical protein